MTTLNRQYDRFLGSLTTLPSLRRLAVRQLTIRTRQRGRTVCYYVPFWLAELFDVRPVRTVMDVSLGNMFLYHYWTTRDDAIDRAFPMDSTDALVADLVLAKALEFFLHTGVEGPLFAADLRRYMTTSLEAEKHLEQHNGQLRAFDRNSILMMGMKAALLNTSAAVLADVSGQRALLATVEETLLRIAVALQMIDDLNDWREDLKRKVYSYPLYLAITSADRTKGGQSPEEPVARALFAGGVAGAVLERARASLGQASRCLSESSRGVYVRSFIAELSGEIESVEDDLRLGRIDWRIGERVLRVRLQTGNT